MDEKYLYLGIAIVVSCWVTTPFLKKQLLTDITGLDLFINTQILILVYGVITLVLLKCCKYEFDLLSINKLNKKQISILSLSALTTFISSVTLLWLVKNYEVSQIMPQIQPLVIVLTILAGIFIFGEKITKTEIMGVVLIVSGVFVVNNFKR
jgi:uncharacterized membrane protein